MKILIVGTVGTGKTTLAKQLAKEYKISCWEIDTIVYDDAHGNQKRSIEAQAKLLQEIEKNQDWIIEGVLRKNFYELLEKADKIIYLDISKAKRTKQILKRYIKQKLGKESFNYKPTLAGVLDLLRWSNEFEMKKEEFEQMLQKYSRKLEIRRN